MNENASRASQFEKKTNNMASFAVVVKLATHALFLKQCSQIFYIFALHPGIHLLPTVFRKCLQFI